MWKCRRKYRLLYHVLPVQLRDQVPGLRNAIVLFAWTIRRLDGQVHCYEVAVSLGILPGSRVLVRGKIKRLHKDLICALVLVEGAVPVGHLIPTWHHFVHYCEFTETHGILRWLWMMAFERCVVVVILIFSITHCIRISLSHTRTFAGIINTSRISCETPTDRQSIWPTLRLQMCQRGLPILPNSPFMICLKTKITFAICLAARLIARFRKTRWVTCDLCEAA